MNIWKYAMLVYVWCTEQAVADGCILDRNEHNKYPWMLRMVMDDVMRCHGILITPKYMVTAYRPLKKLVTQKKELAKLNVIGQVYGPNGEMKCWDSRKATRLSPIVHKTKIMDLLLGLIETAFEVTLNNPYLYPHIKHYDIKMFDDKFAEIIDFECCVVPVFDDRTSKEPKIVEHKVTYLKGPTEEYWRNVHCNGSEVCLDKVTNRNIFAYGPSMEGVTDFSWYQGAAIVCAGNPLAIVEAQLTDPSTSTKITMFHHIRNLAEYFHNYAIKEWPKEALEKDDGESEGKKEMIEQFGDEGRNDKIEDKKRDARASEALKNGAAGFILLVEANILAMSMMTV